MTYQHHHHSENLQSRNSSYSNSDFGSSDKSSHHSRSTQGTQYTNSSRPPFAHYETCEGRLERHQRDDSYLVGTPRSSTETYASTVPSDIDLDEEWICDEYPLPRSDVYEATAIPSTPADFAELFPSERLLSIKHDDSTPDGNMNVRVDTSYEACRRSPIDITLFHLRMHDLKAREFSLRRYCRDSGREVCHSARKYQKSPSERRMSLQRSLSSAFASLRSIAEHKTTPTVDRLRRTDSGYESLKPRKSVDLEHRADLYNMVNKDHLPMPTKSIKLEFSSYAQVEVKRGGAKHNKRYDFEYWGVHYIWKRVMHTGGSSKDVSFHLFRNSEDHALARITPTPLSGLQEREELSRGGWIPPCTMRITDGEILQNHNEISDVVVASGLMALVDDCIKRRFHTKPSRGIVIPVPKFRLDMEFIGTKRLDSYHPGRPSTRGSIASRPITSRA